ncbi:DUF4292 domain-containing protein [Chryseobacterium camelliae]|uniref:DUF4292 domain-containing protein n=1 Tax=Chryseobacterium camelliae TaxID=1265445 RepID=A0ABY7QJ77_9FLAO|nr:DUF4292 domain-containing protein [Chryseobacterium camelliae]WBV59717.1 DUF4292 domain-containing protein [Chryseobacterium camelliae]
MNKWILSILILLVLFSCKTRKTVEQNTEGKDSIQLQKPNDNKPIDVGENVHDPVTFYEKVYIHPQFEYLKISSKITADNIRVSPLDAIIYIETDKKIYSSINFLFINAARALITPEGIKAMDKYNKNYIDSDFEYLNNLLNVNFIDYKNLEKLLVGRTFFTIKGSNARITQNMQGYQLASISNIKIATGETTREYKIVLQYSPEYDLIQVKLQDANSDDSLEIIYDGWETYQNEIRLPKNVKIIIKGTKNSQILLENTKFEFSRMDTRYSVPSNYKKIELND